MKTSAGARAVLFGMVILLGVIAAGAAPSDLAAVTGVD